MNLTHTTARRPWRTTTAVAVGFLIATVALTGCGTTDRTNDDAYQGTLVDPPFQIAPVTLRDTEGNKVRLDRLPDDKATAVFFGFTNCPDICPTTMADLASARRTLPSDLADRVALYFVTVDPNRDTPTVLRTWLDRFDPDIVGLRGPTTLVNEAERSLYSMESTVSPNEPDNSAGGEGSASDHHDDEGQDQSEGQAEPHSHGGGGDEVSHSGSVYMFGPGGESVLYTGGYTVDQYAADLARLLGDPA